MKTVTINVSGVAKTGKSRISTLIYQALANEGFAVEINYNDGNTVEDLAETLEDALASIKTNVNVVINETQLPRC